LTAFTNTDTYKISKAPLIRYTESARNADKICFCKFTFFQFAVWFVII